MRIVFPIPFWLDFVCQYSVVRMHSIDTNTHIFRTRPILAICSHIYLFCSPSFSVFFFHFHFQSAHLLLLLLLVAAGDMAVQHQYQVGIDCSQCFRHVPSYLRIFITILLIRFKILTWSKFKEITYCVSKSYFRWILCAAKFIQLWSKRNCALVFCNSNWLRMMF